MIREELKNLQIQHHDGTAFFTAQGQGAASHKSGQFVRVNIPMHSNIV